MTETQKQHISEVTIALLRFITPLLLVAVIYFVKPLVDAVPRLERQAEVSAVQQQTLVNQVSEVSVKQERVSAQVVQVGTKVEILAEKVERLERKMDK